MLYNDAFRGKYLKAADLGGKTLRVTIVSLAMEQFDDGEKVVVSLKETNQKLVLNKTNAGVLRDSLGDDMDDWCGNVILLKPDQTDLHGKRVPCIRVALPAKKPLFQTLEEGEEDTAV